MSNAVKTLQDLVTQTLGHADRARSARLNAACRELDVTLEAVAKGQPVARETFVDQVQTVVLQAGLVDADTEFLFRDPAKVVAARLA